MENCSGLVVGAVVSHADGFAERASALRLLDCVPHRHATTLGADKGYNMRDFARELPIPQSDAARRAQLGLPHDAEIRCVMTNRL